MGKEESGLLSILFPKNLYWKRESSFFPHWKDFVMLKLVYGKSGSGKSTYLYEDIKNNIDKEKIFLIVPEQSNLKAEQKLFKYLESKSLLNIQVLTLSRLALRVLEETGGYDLVTIDNSAKAMIIYDILLKEKDNLKFLGKTDKNIDIVSNLITEFKKHNITDDLLESVTVNDNLTNFKIKDITYQRRYVLERSVKWENRSTSN